MTLSAASPAPRRRRSILWVVPVFVLVVVVAVIAGKIALERYLQSDEFRRLVSERTGQTLRSRVICAPIRLSGSSFDCDSLEAHGSVDAPFANARIEQVHVEVSPRRFFDGVWLLDNLEVENATINLDGPREPSLSVPSAPAPRSSGSSQESPWLPHRLEVVSAAIRHAGMHWDGGKVEGVALVGENHSHDWTIKGEGGYLVHGPWPRLDLRSFKMLAHAGSLVIESAELRQGLDGAIAVTGEVRFGDSLQLDARVDRLPLEPLLQGDWRLKLLGQLNGTVHIESRLPAEGPPTLTGDASITDGRLQALPVLDQLALFTGSAQFRQLNLSAASGHFRYRGSHLDVSQFVAESSGLARLEGAFTVDHGIIDGAFQVGVSPSTLQWIPGARTRVFLAARDGYVWAPMHVTGPVEKPSEDLTARLTNAAANEVVDTLKNAAGDGGKQLQDTAVKLLNGLGSFLK